MLDIAKKNKQTNKQNKTKQQQTNLLIVQH